MYIGQEQTKKVKEEKKMKNLKQIARATTLTGIIILTTAVANAGILVERSSAITTSPCSESNPITSTIDSILSTIGVTDEGTVCGILVE
jgi:hypothetical protein